MNDRQQGDHARPDPDPRRTACTARPAIIKGPTQNIVWATPEDGGGPNHSGIWPEQDEGHTRPRRGSGSDCRRSPHTRQLRALTRIAGRFASHHNSWLLPQNACAPCGLPWTVTRLFDTVQSTALILRILSNNASSTRPQTTRIDPRASQAGGFAHPQDPVLKSSTGAYYLGLDHIRGVAVLLVFVWHFLYGREGSALLTDAPAIWGPLILFDQGQIGVALFMALSGYLFAKLLDGKTVVYRNFFWNRLLRLLPLLLFVLLVNASISAFKAGDWRMIYWCMLDIPGGLVFPSWPNGGWSITVELHFYLILPFLLMLCKWWCPSIWAVVVCAIAVRLGIYLHSGSVQDAAYWTLIGRIDQFALGLIAFKYRNLLVRQHVFVAVSSLAFLTFYGALGAWNQFHFDPKIISTSPLWIVMPTIEGLTFAALIAWYDGSFVHRRSLMSNIFATVGEYSYSIYLLHFFFVFTLAHWIHTQVLDLSDIYVALPIALLAFAAMLPIGYLSMRFIERPFLRLRQPYCLEPAVIAGRQLPGLSARKLPYAE
jgi:peptidoglycan/LPS O-acetylase OafA/YrhL